MKTRAWKNVPVMVCLVALMALVGCEKPDWNDPVFLTQQIESGDRLRALDNIAKMDKEKKAEVVPALIKAYESDQDKEKVFDLLAQVRDKRALNVYVDALRNGSSNNIKAKAATALGELKVTDHIGTMVDTFKAVPNEDLRRAILTAMVEMPNAQMFPLVTEILNEYDPDREPIAYHSYACDIMAKVDGKQMTDAVVDALVYGMFLDNAKGQNVYKECAAAVFQAGPRATPALVKVLKGKHEKINKRFLRYASYLEGTNEVKAADVLGLIRDPKAAPALVEAVTTQGAAPVTYTQDKRNQWILTQVQLYVYAAGALAEVGLPVSVETLKPFLEQDKKAYEVYKDNIEGKALARHDIFLAAADGMNTIGDRAQLPLLLKAARTADMPTLGRYAPKDPQSLISQPRWESAAAYARLGTGAELEAFDKLIADEKIEGAKKKFQEFRPMLVVAQECKTQAACYGRYLTGDDKIKAEKAAWELGRLKDAEAELIKALGTEKLTVRKGIIASLYRAGSKKSVAAIDALLEKESSRRTPEFKDIHFKMKALRGFLNNKS